MPPAEGALALGQQNFRREVFSTAQSASAASAAPLTVRTYEATLRATVPKFAAKLGTRVLPMSPGDAFYAFLSAVVLLGPKAASPVSTKPGVRRSYVKIVKAAVGCWRAVRGTRAAFALEWSPRMGVFWPGIKRPRVHASLEKCPPLLSDVRRVCTRGESSPARLRQAARDADLPPVGVGRGPLLEEAMVLRSAVPPSVVFFGVGRASGWPPFGSPM